MQPLGICQKYNKDLKTILKNSWKWEFGSLQTYATFVSRISKQEILEVYPGITMVVTKTRKLV